MNFNMTLPKNGRSLVILRRRASAVFALAANPRRPRRLRRPITRAGVVTPHECATGGTKPLCSLALCNRVYPRVRMLEVRGA
jgi:hypothetical protein